MEEVQLKIKITGDDSVAKASGKVETLRSELLKLKEQLASGNLNQGEFDEISDEAAQLQGRISEVNSRVNNLAKSNQSLLVGFSAVAQGIVGGFAASQGAMALFGDENKDLQKQLVKVQGAVALLNGLEAVSNSLKKEGAAMSAIQSVRLKILNFVEAQRAASLEVTGVAMQKAAFGARMFGAALATLGIGLIIAAIVYLIPKISEWVTGSEAATKAQNALKDAVIETDEALANYNKQLEFSTKLAINKAKRDGKTAKELTQITIDAEEKRLEEMEASYAKQGKAWDDMNAEMEANGNVDKEALDELATHNLKLYDEIASQVEKVALLKDDSTTDDKIRQQKASEDEEKERQKDAEKRSTDNKKKSDDHKKYLAEAKKRQDDAREADRLAERALKWEAEDEAAQDELDKEEAAKVRAEKVKEQGEKELTDLRTLNQQKKELKDQELEAELSLQDAKRGALEAGFNIAQSLVGKNKSLAIALLAVQKGVAIAQIIIDTQREISGIAASNALLGAAGVPLTIAQTAAAKVRAATSIATIAATTIGSVSGRSGGGSGGGGGSASPSSNAPQIRGFQTSNTSQEGGGGMDRLQVYVTETAIRNATNKVGSIYSQATVG
jgi:hypothetical protein